MESIAIMVKPVTPMLENTNQPNKVLNQCVSIDIIQSQAIIEDVYPKNPIKIADTVIDFL